MTNLDTIPSTWGCLGKRPISRDFGEDYPLIWAFAMAGSPTWLDRRGQRVGGLVIWIRQCGVRTGTWTSALSTQGFLIRRNLADGDMAYFSTWCPAGITIRALVEIEGHRWAIEDIVVTLKCLRRRGNTIALEPSNARYQPQVLPEHWG